MNEKQKKVTIKDVARVAGVVPSTVSHVIHATATISDETKKRVLDTIKELNYFPNVAAQTLRSDKSGLIGVVLPDISSEFYARCAAGILEEAKKDNYAVLLCDASFNKENKRDGVNALLGRQVDGFIFIGGNEDADIIDSIVKEGIPVVLGDRVLGSIPKVVYDNERTVCNLVCALYENGYRNFSYIGEPAEIQTNLQDRYTGYLKGIKNCAGITSQVIFEENLYQDKLKGGYDVFNKYFYEKHNSSSIIITANDMIAMGIISAAVNRKFCIPKDIAVMGFDNIRIAQYFNPPLTTVVQDIKAMAHGCYTLLSTILIDKKLPQDIILTQKVIVRESAAIKAEILKKYDLI